MTSSDLLKEDSDTDMACEFVRTNTLLRNLQTLHVIASSLLSREPTIEKLYLEIMKLRELREVLDRIARVISRTYAERGDAFKIADDEALILIRELLLQHDPTIVHRNKKRKGSKLQRLLSRIQRVRSTMPPNY